MSIDICATSDGTYDRHLAQFAAWYGLDVARLAASGQNSIVNGVGGPVAAIRLTEAGRFGNIVYQLLNAILLARQIGVFRIEFFPFVGGPRPGRYRISDITFVCRPAWAGSWQAIPTLVGHFFGTTDYGGVLQVVSPAFALACVDRYLRPLFADLRANAVAVGPDTLVLHFRAGDIFGPPPLHTNYVQPPASYYITAIAHARATLGVTQAVLVYEDRGNPAIPVVEAFLRSEGMACSVRSGRFLDDLACLLGATHLVASFSTLVEAVALLSDRLASYASFRRVESHAYMHDRPEPLLLGCLLQRGVSCVTVADAAGSYIPERTWLGDDAQMSMLRAYPAANLAVLEGEGVAAQEALCEVASMRAQAVMSGREVRRLRAALLVVRGRPFGAIATLRIVSRTSIRFVKAALRWLRRRLAGAG